MTDMHTATDRLHARIAELEADVDRLTLCAESHEQLMAAAEMLLREAREERDEARALLGTISKLDWENAADVVFEDSALFDEWFAAIDEAQRLGVLKDA